MVARQRTRGRDARRLHVAYDATRELTVTAALPERGIEPIRLRASKAGPGHYLVSGAPLSPAGEWKLEIAARITEFDELRTTFDVPIE